MTEYDPSDYEPEVHPCAWCGDDAYVFGAVDWDEQPQWACADCITDQRGSVLLSMLSKGGE